MRGTRPSSTSSVIGRTSTAFSGFVSVLSAVPPDRLASPFIHRSGPLAILAIASALNATAASPRTAEFGDELAAEVTVIDPPHGQRHALVTISAGANLRRY